MLSVVIAGPERHPIPLGFDPMKSTVETLDDNRVKPVEVDEETFDVAVDAAFSALRRGPHAGLPSRQGAAPPARGAVR